MRISGLERKSVSKYNKLFISLAVTANISLHAFQIPVWVTLISSVFIFWNILNIYYNISLPHPFVRNLFVILGCFFIYMHYETVMGLEAATAILVLISSIKLIDFSKYKDSMTAIYMCFMLLFFHLLNSQSIGSSIFFGIDILGIYLLIFSLHQSDRRKSIRNFYPAFKILLLAVPVWIFLFIVFPRFQTSTLQLTNKIAQRGFSNQVSPGQVTELTQSDEVVFRVHFNTKMESQNLYFRGNTLETTTGMFWSNQVKSFGLPTFKTSPGQQKVLGEYILEPNISPYIFSLENPLMLQMSADSYYQFSTGSIKLHSEPQTRIQYQVLSDLSAHLESKAKDLNVYLQKPKLSPKLNELVQKLNLQLKANSTTRTKIKLLLNYFTENKFQYTLTPSSLKYQNELEDFLLNKRTGFCEHFAASFGVLARALNIPSRVVVGFQGGTYNPYTDHWSVYTKDAHAWNEIWIAEENIWLRVDPTEFVAPERIQKGERQYEQSKMQSYFNSQKSEELNRKINQAIEMISYKWNSFLLNYDFNYQKRLLSFLGFAEHTYVELSIVLLTGFLFLYLIFKIYQNIPAAEKKPELKIYREFCASLEKLKIYRPQNEGPLDFQNRLLMQFPNSQTEIQEFFSNFINCRYKNSYTKNQIALLKQSTKNALKSIHSTPKRYSQQ